MEIFQWSNNNYTTYWYAHNNLIKKVAYCEITKRVPLYIAKILVVIYQRKYNIDMVE